TPHWFDSTASIVAAATCHKKVSIPHWFDSTYGAHHAALSYAAFQSHTGSIQRIFLLLRPLLIWLVSIPHWFDSTRSRRRKRHTVDLVSIPHWFDSTGVRGADGEI